ncbi:MAG TPA: hypothetical protein VGN64_18140 [Dyadobacter sp.]|jgi:uncharacterized protein YodC (DUF2158 family)|nr:hypothetical protein [Dyadobacter sp.]
MENQEFKEGDWVKEKNGTTGMTVVEYIVDGATSEPTGEVRCRFKNATGDEIEENFWAQDLVTL